jgi:hypothetical protein
MLTYDEDEEMEDAEYGQPQYGRRGARGSRGRGGQGFVSRYGGRGGSGYVDEVTGVMVPARAPPAPRGNSDGFWSHDMYEGDRDSRPARRMGGALAGRIGGSTTSSTTMCVRACVALGRAAQRCECCWESFDSADGARVGGWVRAQDQV